MWAGIAVIVQGVVSALLSFFGMKKAEDDKEKAAALGKTVETVEAAKKVEEDIRDQQKAVDKDKATVEAKDGGLNFDEFNKGKPDASKPETAKADAVNNEGKPDEKSK